MAFTACWGIGTWHRAFAFVGNTNTTTVFVAKFGWDKDEAILYNTIITSAAIVGLVIGSFLSGFLLKIGRRKAAIIGHTCAILGSAIAMLGNTAALTIGRFLIGIAGGVSNVVFGKMVTETIPLRVLSRYAMAHQASTATGLACSNALAYILPDPKDYEANKEDEYWRVIYCAPAMVGVL